MGSLRLINNDGIVLAYITSSTLARWENEYSMLESGVECYTDWLDWLFNIVRTEFAKSH